MDKPFAKSKACAAKCLYAAMKALKVNGGSMMSKEIFPAIEQAVTFSEWELERAGKMQYIRWHNMTQFYSIDYGAAGFLVKKNGYWFLTPEGENVLSEGAEAIMIKANAAYKQMEKNIKTSEQENELESDIDGDKQQQVNIDELQSQAISSIKDAIRSKGPYEFQDMVAAILRAMGYHTPFIAPKGKDGGIDIVAYLDPLGAKTPRIKVQVKHYPDNPITPKDIRALAGVLRTGDIGLFVTSGTFSPEAKREALNAKEYIRIIDGTDFIEFWTEYYDKMADADKNMLTLQRIAFLGSNV